MHYSVVEGRSTKLQAAAHKMMDEVDMYNFKFQEQVKQLEKDFLKPGER